MGRETRDGLCARWWAAEAYTRFGKGCVVVAERTGAEDFMDGMKLEEKGITSAYGLFVSLFPWRVKIGPEHDPTVGPIARSTILKAFWG